MSTLHSPGPNESAAPSPAETGQPTGAPAAAPAAQAPAAASSARGVGGPVDGGGDPEPFTVDAAGAATVEERDDDTAPATGTEPVGPTGRPLPDLPEPGPRRGGGPARVVALVNQKGGVGKTTSTISLGAALAAYGRRVLLLDFDPQGALSVGLGVNPNELDRSVYNLMMDRDVTVDDVVLTTDVPNLHLLPSNIDLSAAEVALVGEVAREQVLARAIRPALDDYDIVLIDCQPSLGLLTVNALTAANGVIIPLECEFFALRGVALLMDTIRKVQDRLNPDLVLDGILATMYDSRTTHSREVLSRVVEAFGDTVFHTVIARTVKFPDASIVGEPITQYAPTSPGADAYRQLAREFLARTEPVGEPA